MALDESAMTDLLAALRAGGGLDVVREALGLVVQALINAEATQQISADRYQRSASRTTHRNGSRPRLLSCAEDRCRVPRGLTQRPWCPPLSPGCRVRPAPDLTDLTTTPCVAPSGSTPRSSTSGTGRRPRSGGWPRTTPPSTRSWTACPAEHRPSAADSREPEHADQVSG
jgi:hypothetical protein